MHLSRLNMESNVYIKKFKELTVEELYQILDLRSRVFVIEQNCIYPDIDGKDEMSVHYMIKVHDVIVSYLRLIPPGIRYDEHAISRVVTDSNYRKFGYATTLIKRALNDIKGLPVRISGQAYLKNYYESLGFVTIKGPYLEDDIPHFEMLHLNR